METKFMTLEEFNRREEDFFNKEEFTLEDCVTLLTEYSVGTLEDHGIDPWDMEKWVLSHDLERWDNYSDEYPRNPYLYGVIWRGKKYAIGYTGIAGAYWLEDSSSSYWDYQGPVRKEV